VRIYIDIPARDYLLEIREFLLDTKSSNRIHDDEYKRRIRDLVTRGRQLAQQNRYEVELKELLDSASLLMDNISNDEFVTVLRHHAGLVADDLSYVDKEGHVRIDTEMLGKLRAVIAPVLAESFKYIPIPRISHADKKRAFWVDNIVICGYDVIPDNVRFQVESDSEVSIRDFETKRSNTKMIITLKHIRTEIKNLDFYFKKKTFPELIEHGRMTICLGGEGASLTMIFRVEQGPEDKFPKLGTGQAHFMINKLSIKFDKVTLKHDILVPIITNMFKKWIIHHVETAVEQNMSHFVQSIGDQLTKVLVHINRPFFSRLAKIREIIKDSDVGQILEKRKEKLE